MKVKEASAPVNRLAVALAAREAMREYRKDKPISFPDRRWIRAK